MAPDEKWLSKYKRLSKRACEGGLKSRVKKRYLPPCSVRDWRRPTTQMAMMRAQSMGQADEIKETRQKDHLMDVQSGKYHL